MLPKVGLSVHHVQAILKHRRPILINRCRVNPQKSVRTLRECWKIGRRHKFDAIGQRNSGVSPPDMRVYVCVLSHRVKERSLRGG